jgi:hypothetical protein
MRRPAHRLAHAPCPYGVFNWSDCDAASQHRWGRCTVMVDSKPEPHPCTNWAVAEDGWCGQHYISLHEKRKDAARKAESQLQLAHDIDAFLELAADPNYNWWEGLATAAQGSRGLAGVPVTAVRQAFDVEDSTSRRSRPVEGPPRVRRLPHRLTEAELADAG